MSHWYTRYRISAALDEGTLAALRAGGHLARCPRCQAHARELESLHARLALGAASAPVPRVPVARRARRPLLVAVPLALAAAALIALALGLPGAPSRVTRVATPSPPALPELRVRDLADRVSALLARSDAPLESELQNLIHDGRRGLDAVWARTGLRR